MVQGFLIIAQMLVATGRAAMGGPDLFGRRLVSQEIAKDPVVAHAFLAQIDHEKLVLYQVTEDLLAVAGRSLAIAYGGRHLAQNGRRSQEILDVLGLPGQDLLGQVIEQRAGRTG